MKDSVARNRRHSPKERERERVVRGEKPTPKGRAPCTAIGMRVASPRMIAITSKACCPIGRFAFSGVEPNTAVWAYELFSYHLKHQYSSS